VSQQNIDIALQGVDAFNRRDLDAFFEHATWDYEWLPAMGAVEGDIVRGRAGIEAFFVSLGEAWGEIRIIAEDCRDLGERVLILGRVEGHGAGSGVPIDAQWGAVVDFRDGKTSRSLAFLDHREALNAAGLSA
jgi:ketosteroid isomerase-like protein